VRDLKSTNGTFLNGRRVEGEVAVHEGDVLRIGSLSFEVQIKFDAETGPIIPPVHASELRWLIESSADAGGLCPCNQTVRLPAPGEDAGTAPAEALAEIPPSSGAVSAGQYLHDYLHARSPRRIRSNSP
jgi:hypothetical protein